MESNSKGRLPLSSSRGSSGSSIGHTTGAGEEDRARSARWSRCAMVSIPLQFRPGSGIATALLHPKPGCVRLSTEPILYRQVRKQQKRTFCNVLRSSLRGVVPRSRDSGLSCIRTQTKGVGHTPKCCPVRQLSVALPALRASRMAARREGTAAGHRILLRFSGRCRRTRRSRNRRNPRTPMATAPCRERRGRHPVQSAVRPLTGRRRPSYRLMSVS